MRHGGRLGAGLACALLLTGCPAGDGADGSGVSTAVAPTSAVPGPATASPAEPADVEPVPAPDPPLTSLRATVELDSAVPGEALTAWAVVGAPDGGAYVVLSPDDRAEAQRLATVAPLGDGFALSRSVELPEPFPVWDVHVLPDGDVLVSGQIRSGAVPGYGFAVVDPRTGESQVSVVVPSANATELADGRTALAPDGETVYLFVGTHSANAPRMNLLVAADVASGRLLAGRDLFTDVRDVSLEPISPFAVWLLARPQGGADLLFDAFPRETQRLRATLLRYDDALEPVDRPVPLSRAGEQGQLQAATATPDGTVYVSVEASAGQLLVAVPPDGTSAIRVLELEGRTYDYAVAVEPAQGWVLLPSARGARAVDLATGGTNEIDVGCRSAQPVRAIVPAATGPGAVLLGRCEGVPRLWITGP